MRLSQLVGKRIKEAPKDAQSASHIFLIRGGYARSLSSGIYTLLPLGKRVCTKIENIIREEMDKVGSQEMTMPLVNPAEIWDESGRLSLVDETLLRFQDRNNKEMVLAMTHEEAVCHMARTELTSYKQLPASVFQIQTKYRDEARPRAGLLRVREFTMKDAYSFHTSQQCLEDYYQQMHQAYERIFKRLGMTEVLSIEADSGMIGGSVSHEFMAVSDQGEDTIIASPCRKYLANLEIATASYELKQEEALPLEKVHTPNVESIEDVAKFLGTSPADGCKAVLYESPDYEGELIFVLIRGDIEVNETKLKNHLKSNVLYPAEVEQLSKRGIVAGFASPLGADMSSVKLIVDPTVLGSTNLVTGANEKDYHLTGFNFKRDYQGEYTALDMTTVKAGDICPVTASPLEELKGIEVGNIFQLGTKYSEAMGVKFLDKNGKSQTSIMGCYGIGVGRGMASVCEQNHDKWGPVWPISIAPYEVHIIALASGNEEITAEAEQLYKDLKAHGVEVILDDRDPKAGFAFNDADLIGVPLRYILSKKSIEKDSFEFKTRDGSEKDFVPRSSALQTILARVEEERKKYIM